MQRDVVLLRGAGGALKAGRVQLHFDIGGQCLSLVQSFTLLRRKSGTALLIWRVGEGPHSCLETQSILAAVEYCTYPDGTVGTVLPIEYS